MESVRSVVIQFHFRWGETPSSPGLQWIEIRARRSLAPPDSWQWSKFSNRQAASHFMQPVIFFVLLAACASFAGVEDITTNGGKSFENTEVIRFQADGLVIKHDGGTNWIGWKDLPTPTRKRFQTEARKRKEEEIQKLKQDLARAEAEAARLKEDDGQPESGRQARPEKTGSFSARRTTGEERGRPLAE